MNSKLWVMIFGISVLTSACNIQDDYGNQIFEPDSGSTVGFDIVDNLSLASGTFVGRVENSESFLAINFKGDAPVSAYLCDGAHTSTWFSGEMNDNGEFSLTSSTGEVISGRFDQQGFSGSLSRSNRDSSSFFVEQAQANAGLFVAEENINKELVYGGWIVLNDGDQRGVVKNNAGVLDPVALDQSVTEEDYEVNISYAGVPIAILQPQRMSDSSLDDADMSL